MKKYLSKILIAAISISCSVQTQIITAASIDGYVYYGDLTGDGQITAADISVLNQVLSGTVSLTADEKKRADLNGDGKIDKSDLELLIDYRLKRITEFPVENMLASIAITTYPTKLTYFVGEAVDMRTAIITAEYNNGSSKIITDYKINYDTFTAGIQEVQVTYTESGVTKNTSFYIQVNEKQTTDNIQDSQESDTVFSDKFDDTDSGNWGQWDDTENVDWGQWNHTDSNINDSMQPDEMDPNELYQSDDMNSEEIYPEEGMETDKVTNDGFQESDNWFDENKEEDQDDDYYNVQWNVSSAVLQKGKSTVALVAYVTGDDEVIKYKSSNKSIVTVNKNGKIKAKRVGTAYVTALTKHGCKARIRIKVQKKAVTTKKIVVNQKNIKLKAGKTFLLQTEVTPLTSSQSVTYMSSNSKIASVGKNGKVKAKRKGKAVIRVKSGRKEVKVKVTVK